MHCFGNTATVTKKGEYVVKYRNRNIKHIVLQAEHYTSPDQGHSIILLADRKGHGGCSLSRRHQSLSESELLQSEIAALQQ